jgi:type IV pilus assembly protein PilB
MMRGAGCAECRNIGYRVREAVTQISEMSGELRESVLRGEPASRLRETAVAHGMITLRQDGIDKAVAGLTTLEELFRVLADA